MGDLKLAFVFRRPRFPIVCNVDGELVAGRSAQQFQRLIARVTLPPNRVLEIVDVTGEGWGLHTDLSAISPLMLDKRWTKARVIELFNTSLNATRTGFTYPRRSLANRRLEVVISEVAELVMASATQDLAADGRKDARG